MFWDVLEFVLGCSMFWGSIRQLLHIIRSKQGFHGISWHGAWNRWKMKAALRDELPSDSASGDEDCGPGEQDQAVPQHPLCTLRTLHTHGGR